MNAAEMLEAALRAFATYGFEGTSVRTLSRDLGVSHNLINQRFGTKADLWHAAVDHTFVLLTAEITRAIDPTISDPLVQLNRVVRQLLRFTAEHPEVLALMNVESGRDTDRLDYLYDTYLEPSLRPLAVLLDHLIALGRIRPVSLRTLHFLITTGGAAPYTLIALARRFEGPDPLDPEAIEHHIAMVADIITSGLALDSSG